MKRYLPLLLALAGLSQAGGIFFSGVTAVQTEASSANINVTGNAAASFYASGPNSGTWTAVVTVYEKKGDGSLRNVVTFNLSNAGPNINTTYSKAYDDLDVTSPGGFHVAAVTAVTGTIPAPGLFAENK